MSRTLWILIGLAMFLPLAAAAQPVTFGPQGESIMATPVATVVAEPGESDEAFLLRRGKLFRGYTASTGFEACAQVCRAPDGRLGLSVYTSGSHIGCAIINKCPDGMVETGETIHSHPQARAIRSNAADRAFMRARRPGAHVPRYQALGVDHKTRFSHVDYASGPGYLVDGDVMLYQSGPGKVRQVGVIPPAE